MPTRPIIATFESKFAQIRCDSELAIAQLDSARLRRSLDGDVNSVAIEMANLSMIFFQAMLVAMLHCTHACRTRALESDLHRARGNEGALGADGL